MICSGNWTICPPDNSPDFYSAISPQSSDGKCWTLMVYYIAMYTCLKGRGGGGNCLTFLFPVALVSNNLCCSVYQKSCLQCSNFHKLHFAIYLLTKSRQMGEGGWAIRWNDSGAEQGCMGFK